MSANSGEKHEKLWGGRFTSEASALLWKYNASIGLDKEGFRNDALIEPLFYWIAPPSGQLIDQKTRVAFMGGGYTRKYCVREEGVYTIKHDIKLTEHCETSVAIIVRKYDS